MLPPTECNSGTSPILWSMTWCKSCWRRLWRRRWDDDDGDFGSSGSAGSRCHVTDPGWHGSDPAVCGNRNAGRWRGGTRVGRSGSRAGVNRTGYCPGANYGEQRSTAAHRDASGTGGDGAAGKPAERGVGGRVVRNGAGVGIPRRSFSYPRIYRRAPRRCRVSVPGGSGGLVAVSYQLSQANRLTTDQQETYASSEGQFLHGAAGTAGSVESGANDGDRRSHSASDRSPRKHGATIWGGTARGVLCGLWRHPG